MKTKRIVLLLVTLLLLVGCSNKPSTPKTKDYSAKEIITSEGLEIEIISVTKKESISSFLEFGSVVKPSESDYEYLDVVLNVKNTNNNEVDLSSLQFNLSGDQITQGSSIYLETQNYSNVTNTAVLESGKSYRLHLVSAIKEDVNVDQVVVNFEKEAYLVKATDLKEEYKQVKYQDVLNENGIEVIISEAIYTTKIVPGDTAWGYHYLSVSNDDEEFLVFEVKVTNNSTETKELAQVLGFKKAHEKYNTPFTWYLEDDDERGFSIVNTIEPGENKNYKLVTIVQKGMDSTSFVGHFFESFIELSER